MPNDKDSLLDLHSDIYAGKSFPSSCLDTTS